MELPSLDIQCNETDCNQLNFLPLYCKCGKAFCSNHFNTHVQNCVKSRYLLEEELKKIENVFICSHKECKERSVIPLLCEKCKQHLCIKHRHLEECNEKDPAKVAAELEKYAAPMRQFQDVKRSVDMQLDNKLAEVKNKVKNRDTVHKIQLMRLKNKAIGLKSVSPTDRLYFNVLHTKAGNEKPTAVFVSKQWSIGRTIDAIAQELKLENNNNRMNERKLRLFKKDDKAIIFNKLSTKLITLLEENLIYDGEDLIIEYVENDCIKLV